MVFRSHGQLMDVSVNSMHTEAFLCVTWFVTCFVSQLNESLSGRTGVWLRLTRFCLRSGDVDDERLQL